MSNNQDRENQDLYPTTTRYNSDSFNLPGEELPEQDLDAVSGGDDFNAAAFSNMLDQYNQLQQQTMTENMEMQSAQAFWNPLESMSKSDATQ